MTETRRLAVITHGAKLDPVQRAALRATIEAAASARGLPAPEWWLETSEGDPGAHAASRALREGAELVVVAGGDGTVSSCAAALAGTGVPLGIVPWGTGNLIARNLGLPTDPGAAIEAALGGAERRIDVGRCGDRVVVGMAGLGLDATMVADAPPALKKRWGWPAYVVSIARHVRDRGVTTSLTLDGARYERHGVRALVVGNIARLPASIALLPDASPDSGTLDLVVLAPSGILNWLRVVGRLLARRRPSVRGMERFRARHISIRTRRPVEREIDGEPIGAGDALDIEVEPAALVVRVARAAEPSADRPRAA